MCSTAGVEPRSTSANRSKVGSRMLTPIQEFVTSKNVMKQQRSVEVKAMASRFPIYKAVILPGAVRALLAAKQSPMEFLTRHQQGDWGEAVNAIDWLRNDEAIERRLPLLSCYCLSTGTVLIVFTPADHSRTVAYVEGEDPSQAQVSPEIGG